MAMRQAPACSADYEEAKESFFDEGGKHSVFQGEFKKSPNKLKVRKTSRTKVTVSGGQGAALPEDLLGKFEFTKPDEVPEWGICKGKKEGEDPVHRMHVSVNRPLFTVVRKKNQGLQPASRSAPTSCTTLMGTFSTRRARGRCLGRGASYLDSAATGASNHSASAAFSWVEHHGHTPP